MAGRPKPTILNQISIPNHQNLELQVVQGSGFYVITYDDSYINLIKVNHAQHLWRDTKKYMKIGYVHRAHADRQVIKLNKLFKTDKFQVKELK